MLKADTGKLVVIEGLDGSGKATQTKILVDYLKQKQLNVQTISFPQYESRSATFVKMYLAGELGGLDEVNVYAASTFYSMDRYVSYKESWQKIFTECDLLVCDRYTTSNICHQMSKLPKAEWAEYLKWLYNFEFEKLCLPAPEMVVYLDMPPQVSANLITQRYGGDESKKDIHEKNLAYLEKCREAALFAAEQLGWRVIMCAEGEKPLTIEEISAKIWAELKSFINF